MTGRESPIILGAMTEIEKFRDEVERAIRDRQMSAARFGMLYASDPLFVYQLRKGREPRTETRQRILAALAEQAA